MVPRLTFTLDCLDPETLATFWVDALGYSSFRRARHAAEFWLLFPADDREPLIVLQQVADAKRGKNRMHLDLHAEDLEGEVARLRALGARRLTEDPVEVQGYAWLVMADPEGNEFCVVQRPEVS
jgi:predicted enzyme related to lactoylglutathione lyase